MKIAGLLRSDKSPLKIKQQHQQHQKNYMIFKNPSQENPEMKNVWKRAGGIH